MIGRAEKWRFRLALEVKDEQLAQGTLTEEQLADWIQKLGL